MRRSLSIMLISGMFMACSGDLVQINEDRDKTVLVIHKSENANVVHYAVRTNGACEATDVIAYWKMHEDGGHTEALLDREEPYYGIVGKEVSPSAATFAVAQFPDKRITVLVQRADDEATIRCSFDGVATISDQESIVDRVFIEHAGWSVKRATLYGVLRAYPVTEVSEVLFHD